MEKKHKFKRWNIVLLLLLAILCIAGAELAACKLFDPEHYEQITGPVRHAATTALDFLSERGTKLTANVSLFWENLRNSTEDLSLPESQLVAEPTITSKVVADPLLTELQVIDGQQMLTGGLTKVVYFNQGDSTWANLPYGTDKIGGYGCGPTALAMAVASLTGVETNPAIMAQWAVDHGYWASQNGSYLSIVEGTATAFGLQAESFSGRTVEELTEELLNGKMLIALMGPGHFTKGGHFILLRGVTLSNQILIADPNSTQRSLIVWDPQIILDELSASTSDGAPLWSIWQETPP